ncbi:MAG: chemotaxis protein CheB [Bacteroidota bacterium]
MDVQAKKLNTGQFPIVGIGASAGGLEALEQYLGNVPSNSGMAYIVIQHLDPTQKDMLPELLQRITKMKVVQVTDGMVVKPNCVYVIPPNTSMSIVKGVLHLFEPTEIRGLRLPIDFFLQSLARDQQERSIGLILSGMGSDGSAGVREIKEQNGIVMVQDPATAKYDSMPRNAIDAVQVDIVAPVSELPSRLFEFLKHVKISESDEPLDLKEKSALDKIILLLRTYTGNDFTLYKKNTLYRRIERRMGVYKIDKISSYVSFLQENPKEVGILFKELMIGVTSFFRDPHVWEMLKETITPNFITNLQPGSILRAWVPGCSTGEEAYSLAIVFKEVIEKTNPHGGFSLQIFATDLDNEAIEIARKGIFPASIAADISPARLNRFFLPTDDGFFINTEIRETVVFAQHNLIMHPPFTRIDFLSCRNLLIYLEPELQTKLLGLFSYCINPGGILLLGSSETLGNQSHLFTTLDAKLKIFQRDANTPTTKFFNFPVTFSHTQANRIEKPVPPDPTQNIQTLADQLLLQHSSIAGVLVNESGDIIYISGRTGKYLEPSVGKANMNIFAMLREGLQKEFPIAFRKALLGKETVLLHNIKVGTNGDSHTIDINITFIDKPLSLNGMVMIIFTEVAAATQVKLPAIKEKKVVDNLKTPELEEELKKTREKMNVTLEEMQTSQEELQTTNEELQSTNEELQSANEELTSSKEEMQSLNEELQTLNAELQSKVDDFTRINSDMKNLLNSTDIATLFLDNELNIRRFTDQTTKIFKLIKSDIGRPFTDLVTDLDYPYLSDDVLKVLKTSLFIQKPIPTKDGRWFSIRIMPYRTLNEEIDGVVITFFNISDLKKIELKLHETDQMNNILLNSSSKIIFNLSADWNIQMFNPQAELFFGKKRGDVLDQNFIRLFIPEPAQKKVQNMLKKILNASVVGKFSLKVLASGGKVTLVKWSVDILLNNLKMPVGMIITQKE